MDKNKYSAARFLASSLLTNELANRYDICHCPSCRNAMLEYVLSKTPQNFFDNLKHAVQTEDEKVYSARILPFIRTAIEKIAQHPTHKTEGMTEEGYQLLVKRILEDRRLDFRFCHQEILRRQVAERMQDYNLSSYTEYLDQLIKNPDEYNRLLAPFSLYMEEFFLDNEVWVTIKYMLDNLIRTKTAAQDTHIHIWNAGCGWGEDAFSLAILFHELMGYEIKKFTIKITATESEKECLKFLQHPTYNREELQTMDKSLRIRYLNIAGMEYEPKEEIKKLVHFRELNLNAEEIIKDVDVVFCRNTFIYLNRIEQRHLLYRFHRALKPQGYIVLGKVEKVIDERIDIAFQEIDASSRIFKKK